MFVDPFEEELCALTDAKNWQCVLKLSESLPLEKKSKYLWTWPTKDTLQCLKLTLSELNIRSVLSVGCGSGLLEWIIQESIGFTVYGLEVDKSWWESNYSPKSFIKLNYVDGSCMTSEFLKVCCGTDNWEFALLFCFFNNGEAFQEYMRLYKGSVVIIIGPDSNIGIHTDPSPFKADFVDSKWKLWKHFNISKDDIIAFYRRS